MSKSVEIHGLTVVLNGREVLSDISLDLDEGRFLGIVGPNGGGKTTFLRVVLGLVKPSAGRVAIFGKTPKEAVNRGFFGYLPQHLNVDADFPATARDVVLMGLSGRAGAFRRPSRGDTEKAVEMLATMGMSGYENHIFGSLSGGQQ